MIIISKVILNEKESFRYEIIKKLVKRKGNKLRAACVLNCSIRTIDRLIKSFLDKDKRGFIHGNKNRKPLHSITNETKVKIISLYKEKYYDFNFKHFHEFLIRKENISCSYPTVINILYSQGILSAKTHSSTKKRIKKALKLKEKSVENIFVLENTISVNPKEAHPRKPRAKYFGELIQLDASVELWFGNEKTFLHAAIDDSTGKIVGAYFDKQETLKGYYQVTAQILENYGIPSKFLTDKRTVFEYKKKGEQSAEKDTSTQFGYACSQLGIQIETTSVPQAKGRVERLFGTLQSRLKAELRLSNVTDITHANEFLKGYLEKFNEEFSQELDCTTNAFESKVKKEEINLYLSTYCERIVDKGHSIKYNHKYYFILDKKGNPNYLRAKTNVSIVKSLDGELYALVGGETCGLREIESHERISKEFDLTAKEEKKGKYIPPASHPWKAASYKNYLDICARKNKTDYIEIYS